MKSKDICKSESKISKSTIIDFVTKTTNLAVLIPNILDLTSILVHLSVALRMICLRQKVEKILKTNAA